MSRRSSTVDWKRCRSAKARAGSRPHTDRMSQIRVSAQLQPQHSDWSAMRQAWLEAEELGVDWLFNWDHFYPLCGEPDGKHFECADRRSARWPR